MNKAVFHTGDLSQSYGRKIDMILKCSATTNVDISSNEWKKANVSKSIKFCQQSKNLRLNMSNLFILEAKFGVDFTIAVDFVGNAGYLYMLRLIHDGPDDHDHVGVAHLITTFAIPSSLESFDTLKETLEGLVTFKDHLVAISRKSRGKYPMPSTLHSSTAFAPPHPHDHLSPKSPFIFFTPKRNRPSKRKFLELLEDENCSIAGPISIVDG